jgi:hypothetical protein
LEPLLWLLHYGYEPITETEDYFLIYGFGLILLFLIFIAYRLIKNKLQFFSYGLLIGLIPIIFVFYSNTVDYYKYLTPADFDKKVWIACNPKPYEMSRSLIKNGLLNKLTKKEVIELLGSDFSKDYSDDSTIVYQLDIAKFTYLEIHFNKTGITRKVNFRYND